MREDLRVPVAVASDDASRHRSRWRTVRARTKAAAPLIAAALCAYAVLNLSTLWPHLSLMWKASPVSVIAYLLLYAVAGVSFGALLMSLHRYLLLGAVVLLVVIVTTNRLAMELLDLKVVNQQSAEWLLWEMREARNAVDQFSAPFARNLAISIASLVPMVCVARVARARFREQLKSVPVAVGAAFLYMASGLALYHGFKPYIPVESNLLVYGAGVILQPSPDIPSVDMQPAGPPEVDQVILVVDESVTYEAYVTQLRAGWSSWDGIDFGEAASLGNCSASTNSMLRWGLRAKQMLAGADPRLTPTIWSYARAAGYETILIDGQRSGSYQNYMRGKEAALIDRQIGIDEGFDTDLVIARVLHELMEQPGRRFVYINKRGSHFPYSRRYPLDRFPGATTAEEHHALAVWYTSGAFLDIALKDAALGRALVLYTSDHGERFGEGSPHCNAVPVWQESSVPLVLLTGNTTLARQARAAAAVLKDRASHEQIFATLIHAMGYDLRAAETEYGSSLLTARAPQRYFHVLANPVPTKKRQKTVIEFSHFPHRPPQSGAARSMAAD